jgi:hypothetical protein
MFTNLGKGLHLLHVIIASIVIFAISQQEVFVSQANSTPETTLSLHRSLEE